ncbi:MAG: TonB-dependent hemoglobin/transferrin/lactoferrin family receptor [Methylovirgula sp.]|uniref:TonB-dependent hemoglobin/transferrin/lactoferrin family receptor n=1 Tax=Methylovirgula sp. TaxID=1978224 RepID=UPI0030760534
MSSMITRALLASVSFLAISPAYAQSASPTQTSPAAPQATNSPVNQDGSIPLDTISVTATMTQQPVIDAMGGVSSVTEDKIKTFHAQNFNEVLQDVPGVTMQMSPSDPGQSINIRGLQDFGRVNVLVDGARQDYQISGHNANGTFYLDPMFVSDIDIVRGPISNIYGSGAIGGVVSFTTRGVDDVLLPNESYGAIDTVGYGSNGAGVVNSVAGAARMGPGGTAGDIYGQFLYRDTTSYHDGSGNLISGTGSELAGGLLKINVRPADGQQVTGTALIQKFNFDNNSTADSGPLWNNDVNTSQFTLGYTAVRPDIPWLDFSIKAYASQTENQQTLRDDSGSDAGSETYALIGALPGDSLYDMIHTYGFDVHDTARFNTAMFNHAVTFGGDGVWDFVNTQDDAGGYISATTPSGQRSLNGAFVQDEVRYSTWLDILGALRFDHYSLNGGGTSSGGTHLSPKITVGITPIAGVQFYATYADGYRAPSVTETLIDGAHPFPAFDILPNPNLRPEVANDVEGGVNLKFNNILRPDDQIRVKADAYLNTIHDYVDFEPVGAPYLTSGIPGGIPGIPAGELCQFIPGACFPITNFQYLNIGEAQISGVELEGTYDWGGGYITVAGTHINGKSVSDPSTPLYSIPPDRISGTLGLRFLDRKLVVGSRLTLVEASQQFPYSSGDESSSSTTFPPTAGYALVDLFASYKYNDDVSASLTVKNLLNKEYTQYLDNEANPGLQVLGSVTVRFASK